MNNKRKYERLTCLVPVDGKKGGAFEKTQTVDISKKGLGFISKNKVPLNKKIAIELNLAADQEPVFVIGQIKWVRPVSQSDYYRVGVFFKDVLKGSQSRLQEYFRK